MAHALAMYRCRTAANKLIYQTTDTAPVLGIAAFPNVLQVR